MPDSSSPFRISVINDEISQDFGRACEVASREFGMGWMELRGMWKKNIVNLDEKQVAEAQPHSREIPTEGDRHRQSPIQGRLAGRSKIQSQRERRVSARTSPWKQQDEVLDRAMEMAKSFQTDRVRCFDFWRLEDQAPYRAAINDKLRDAAAKAEKKGIILVLENESACNTATGAEAAKVLDAVKTQTFMLNWDPGNAAAAGEIPFPMATIFCPRTASAIATAKISSRRARIDWAPMGGGLIDWAGQFKALEARRLPFCRQP